MKKPTEAAVCVAEYDYDSEDKLLDSPDNPPTCYKDGKRHGQWELNEADTYNRWVSTGLMVDGKRQGLWKEWDSGSNPKYVHTGTYVDGKKHGLWENRYLRHGDEVVSTGTYVDGKKHGEWDELWHGITRTTLYEHGERKEDLGLKDGRYEGLKLNGDVHIGVYEDGKKRGQWEIRKADGSVESGEYIYTDRGDLFTVKHWHWETRDKNGNLISSGEYEYGKKHGKWEYRFADGRVESGEYEYGKKHEQWEYHLADGRVESGEYVEGVKRGRWKMEDKDGKEIGGGAYDRDGKRYGPWLIHAENGVVRHGQYVNGKQHQRWEIKLANGKREWVEYVNGVEFDKGVHL